MSRLHRRKPEFDLAVIGAGAAGLVAASGAAQLGARVVLFEDGAMGGECLNSGCVPSKALLHAARFGAARNVSNAGFAVAPETPDLVTVLNDVRNTIAALAPKDSAERMASLGVEVVRARARFRDSRTLEAAGRKITARRFLVATGSRAVVPAIPGIDAVPVLTNETVFSLAEPVPRLLVLGAGPEGVELAQAFARLGSRVTLLEAQERLLPGMDSEAGGTLASVLAREGVDVRVGVSVMRAGGVTGDLWLEYVDNGNAKISRVEGSHLLIAAGRRPALDELGLDAAGVAVHGGCLVLDHRLRTTCGRIYAAGDAAGAGLTHAAERQAQVVLMNALFHWPARWRPPLMPRVVYTDPEVAEVGVSEQALVQAGRACRVWRAEFADVDRAVIEHAEEGFVKFVASPGGRLLGATIVAARAGEMIHEAAFAIAARKKLSALSGLIHAYPTYAQGLRFAADARRRAALTPARKRLIRFLFRLHG